MVVSLVFIGGLYFLLSVISDVSVDTLVCGDGTSYDSCSLRKPYHCLDGSLVNLASLCGCPSNLEPLDNFCVSQYQTDPRVVTLNYVLRGEENEIKFIVYGGMADYLSTRPLGIQYNGEERPSRGDFKLRNINEPEQREFLLPLVTKIQNIADAPEDQVRIAISLVQKIPFGEADKGIFFGNANIDYARYPYEVIYDMQGICGEKSELLAFLLKEIGYGVVFFYHQLENHESLGIKCPVKYSLDESGYCFIETTGSSILTDNEIEYVGGIKLISDPEIILISEGRALGKKMYEFDDAPDLIKIRRSLEVDGKLNLFESNKFEILNEKYGLEEVYNA